MLNLVIDLTILEAIDLYLEYLGYLMSKLDNNNNHKTLYLFYSSKYNTISIKKYCERIYYYTKCSESNFIYEVPE